MASTNGRTLSKDSGAGESLMLPPAAVSFVLALLFVAPLFAGDNRCPFEFTVAAPRPAPELADVVARADEALYFAIGALLLSIVFLIAVVGAHREPRACRNQNTRSSCSRLK